MVPVKDWSRLIYSRSRPIAWVIDSEVGRSFSNRVCGVSIDQAGPNPQETRDKCVAWFTHPPIPATSKPRRQTEARPCDSRSQQAVNHCE